MGELEEFALRKFVAPEFIFGMDARKLAGRYTKNYGARRILVVTDPGVMAAGWMDEVVATLREAGLESIIFSAVTSNPKMEEVMAGAAVYRQENCNAIVAVGGGSPMDCAKGIGIVSTNSGHIIDFEGVDKVELPLPPLIFIPTTAGSSADVSQFAIITNTAERIKMAIVSKMIVPDVALIDPVTTTTMSSELTAATGMDALCHAVEAYVSTAHSPITDLNALAAIDLVTGNLLPAVRKPDDLVLRGKMMLASLEAGLAFSNASLGATHAMAHSLGGVLDCPHGECNALLLPLIIEFNFPFAAKRYRRVAEAMGLEAASMTDRQVLSALKRRITSISADMGITERLTDMGVGREHLPSLAEKALRDPCMITNPRQATREEIEAIYVEAL